MINPVGMGILVFMAYFGFRGFQRGLIDEVGRLVGLVLAIILANKFTLAVAGYIGVVNPTAQKALAFVGIFILTMLGMTLVARALRTLVELVLLEWLDRLGGTVFGALKSIIVMGVMIYVVESFDVTHGFVGRLTEQSFVYRNLVIVKNGLFKALTLDDMIRDVHLKIRDLRPDDLLRPLMDEH